MCCEEDKGEQCEQQRTDIKSSQPADVSSSKIHIMHLPMFRLLYVRYMLVERVKIDLWFWTFRHHYRAGNLKYICWKKHVYFLFRYIYIIVKIKSWGCSRKASQKQGTWDISTFHGLCPEKGPLLLILWLAPEAHENACRRLFKKNNNHGNPRVPRNANPAKK